MSSKTGWLNNVTDNIFNSIKKDFKSLCWIVDENDANLSWYFSKSDGSFAKNGQILFWYGLNTEQASELIKDFDNSAIGSPLSSSKESGVFSTNQQKRGLHTKKFTSTSSNPNPP